MTTTSGEKNEKRITGKILLHGALQCVSPLHIGSGRGEHSGSDILLDDNGKPFIPGSSLIGVLRAATKNLELSCDATHRVLLKKFWGYTETINGKSDGHQSTMHCSDLYCIASPFQGGIRDGVKINHATGMAEDQKNMTMNLLNVRRLLT